MVANIWRQTMAALNLVAMVISAEEQKTIEKASQCVTGNVTGTQSYPAQCNRNEFRAKAVSDSQLVSDTKSYTVPCN